MAKLEISTLTPVHIGNGRQLEPKIEFVFGQNNIGIVDEHKVYGLIGHDKLNAWINAIDHRMGLIQFLQTYQIRPRLQEVASRLVALDIPVEGAGRNIKLKEQIHDGTGHPYIPGSSLKGAIRSAIFNTRVRKNGRSLQAGDLTDYYGKISAGGMEKKFFGQDPNHDVFRFLRVGDALFPKGATCARIISSMNQKQNEVVYDPTKAQLVEAIAPGKSCVLNLSFSETGIKRATEARYINELPDAFGSVEMLLNTLHSNTLQLLEEELKNWEEHLEDEVVRDYCQKVSGVLEMAKQCKPGSAVLRVGYGVGYTFINGNWINDQGLLGDEHYGRIVDIARPRNQQQYSNYPFPKSRRFGEAPDVTGFVKLKLL